MDIRKCTQADILQLADFNKQLIEDEKSTNPMTVPELVRRMEGFLATDYDAYFFTVDDTIVGYALVKTTCSPLYLRQFFICREYRRRHYGRAAFDALLACLGTDLIDLEVLPWNEAGMRFWESCGFREISRYLRLER